MSSDYEEQQDELLALVSIFDPEEFVRKESKSSGEFRVNVELPEHFTVTLKEGDALSKYELSSLPPLGLTFDLPEDYPSCFAPSYSLNCSWLGPTQLSSLAAQLDDLYQSTGGAVVLFSWVQFLKHEALGFLGISDILEIPSNEKATDEDGSTANLDREDHDVVCQSKSDLTPDGDMLDTAAAASEAAESDEGASCVARFERQSPLSLSPGQALLSQLLIHDAAQRQKAFCSQQFDCGVCFLSWLGADCVQLIECGHVFCKTCLSEFYKVQITNGSVRDVTCLQPGCKAAPTPAQVRSVVGEELFSRYDRLLLQSALDSMSDVMYCPRPSCASAVLTDSSSSMALCTVCSFAFCTRCKKTYHGTEPCPSQAADMSPSEEDNPYLPKTEKGLRALWEDYEASSREKKKLLEKWYGKKALKACLENWLSIGWKISNSKTCPHCFSPIEKLGGCKVMTCSHCLYTAGSVWPNGPVESLASDLGAGLSLHVSTIDRRRSELVMFPILSERALCACRDRAAHLTPAV